MKRLLLLAILAITTCNASGQTQSGYDTAFYRKLQQKPKGFRLSDAKKMTDKEQMKQYFAAKGMLAPAKLGDNPVKPKAVTPANAATMVTKTAGYLEGVPALPNSVALLFGDGFSNKALEYKTYIDNAKLTIEITNNKIAGADAAKHYPMATGNDAETTVLKLTIQYQQSQDVTITNLGNRKQQLHTAVGDSVKRLVVQYQQYANKCFANNTVPNDAPYIKRADALRENILNQFRGLYDAYKIWYALHAGKADAILANAAYGANIQGVMVRNNMRSLQDVFYGHALQMLYLADECKELIGSVHYR